MKNDPSDRLKRFKILQVKAERLYREAVAHSKWDTYSEVLALIDLRNSEYRLWMREDEMSKQTHLRGLPKIKITDNGQTKTSHIIREMRGKFKVSKMPYISKEIDKWFPPPATRTERVFLMSVEPDEGTFHKAASEIDPGRQGITVRERLLYELVYFDKAGGHLDLQGQTICSGSQGVRVGSPRVFFDDEVGRGELSIHLEGIDTPYELGGFRMPVSFQE